MDKGSWDAMCEDTKRQIRNVKNGIVWGLVIAWEEFELNWKHQVEDT